MPEKKNQNLKISRLSVLFLIASVFFQTMSAYSSTSSVIRPARIIITSDDLKWFGNNIFQKECGGDITRLCTWNPGEEFPSFGIGHFIWYPQGYEGPFEESFPVFLSFLSEKGVAVPSWIKARQEKGSPWQSRKQFYMQISSGRMKSLRSFLVRTMPYQSLFIVNRFKNALPKMMRAVPPEKKKHVRQQFFRVADSSRKLYALIDYVNFKGEGVKISERYKNEGWGLLQVLEEMKGAKRGDDALHEFSRAAEAVLIRRVNNAPLGRNEKRWLNGWKNRVSYYRTLSG